MRLGPTLRRIFYALAGVALGGLGIGWHGQPTDAAIIAAIRARDPLVWFRADITVVDVDRDWFHEVYGLWDSHFLVTVKIAPRGKPAAELCFEVEPGIGTALASGPYAQWRCDYPF